MSRPLKHLLHILPLLAYASFAAAQASTQPLQLEWQAVADGVEFAAFDATAIVGEPGPLAVHALRLDLARVRLDLALAEGRSPALETVDRIAARAGAIAAVNAGFFAPGGRPAGLMRVDYALLGPTAQRRVALGLVNGQPARVVIDHVQPAPAALLAWGSIWPMTWFRTGHGTSPLTWQQAEDVIGGRGLIVRGGHVLDDWSDEGVRGGFVTDRHPRTLAGVAGDGTVWLLTIDGRQPSHSVGVNFAGLTALARSLGLVDAINLDGGGSTTMVVQGRIVNRPSDLTGPRPVSDALIVRSR